MKTPTSEMKRTRKSVPTKGIHQWWMSGWSYIMPDFDKPGNSIVEWYSDKPPLFVDDRVPVTPTRESADVGTDNRPQ